MSYILEALKRSQIERELGRVPTLEVATLAITERPTPRSAPWAMIAAAFAAAAVTMAITMILRWSEGPGALVRGPGVTTPVVPAPDRHTAAPDVQVAGPAPVVRNPSAQVVSQWSPGPPAPPPAAEIQSSAAPSPPVRSVRTGAAMGPTMPGSPGSLWGEAPLVEAPPPKGGLGLGGSPLDMVVKSAQDKAPLPVPAALNDMDAQWERQLQRQLASDPATAAVATELVQEVPRQEEGPSPVPADLIADIDSFKHRVKGGQGTDKGKDPRANPTSDDAQHNRPGRTVQSITAVQERSPGVLATPARQGRPPQPGQLPEQVNSKGLVPPNLPPAETGVAPSVAVPGRPEMPVQRVKPSAEGDPSRLRLTPEQQASLPKFQMNVHVYNTDPSRRFILINGLKYGEGARTREGFKVVEIRLDGVVLDHQGHPFFVHR